MPRLRFAEIEAEIEAEADAEAGMELVEVLFVLVLLGLVEFVLVLLPLKDRD